MIYNARKLIFIITLVCSHSVTAEQVEFPAGITVQKRLHNTAPVTVLSDSELVKKQSSKSKKSGKAGTEQSVKRLQRIQKPLRNPRVNDVINVQQKPEVIHLDQSEQMTDVVNTSDRFLFRDITQRNGANNISAAELAKRKNIIERLRHGAGI